MIHKRYDFKGLRNTGNNCYINSNTQLLKLIFDYSGINSNFDDIYYSTDINTYNKYIEFIKKKGGININDNSQQDAQEFIQPILNDINDINKKFFNIEIKKLYYCKVNNIIKHYNFCDNQQSDSTLMLMLCIPENTTNTTLIELMDNYLKEESIDQSTNNSTKKFYCQGVSVLKGIELNNIDLVSKYIITHLSKFLILNIKRFSDLMRKNSCNITIYESLSITTYGKQDIIKIADIKRDNEEINNYTLSPIKNNYILIGITVHSGLSLHSGHYYNYSKNIIDKTWSCINDNYITNVGEFSNIFKNKDVNMGAYLLVYCKV